MDLKQIITLHLNGYSNRNIGSALGISCYTVNTYMKRFKTSEYSCKQLLEFDNAILTASTPPAKPCISRWYFLMAKQGNSFQRYKLPLKIHSNLDQSP